MIYRLTISCVDGISYYEIASPNKSTVLQFLRQFDHEGSNIYLETRLESGRIEHMMKDNEIILNELR